MSSRRPPYVYEFFFRTVLERIDSERAHRLGLGALRAWGLVPGARRLTGRALRPPASIAVDAFGLHFDSPLGVAAGVDKNSKVFDDLAALGFGAVEVGTATALAQRGRPGTRVWRLPEDRALQNAMGFPNEGAGAQARNLSRRRTDRVIGVNIGKSKIVDAADAVADYRASTRLLAPHADYLAINVSSPNTPGLRDMQSAELLGPLVSGVRAELEQTRNPLPVLVKLGPDLADEEIRALGEAASQIRVDGIIAVNTTTDYDGLDVSRGAIRANGDIGGISGRPLKARAEAVLALLGESAGDVPLISVGGIEDGRDVWERILAGATLVQAHTGFVYGGPLWPSRLNAELARLLDESAFATLAEAVGTRHREPHASSTRGRVDAPVAPVAW